MAAECRETVSVIDDIKMCIAELEQENQIAAISVEAVDGEVARIFLSSPRSEVCHHKDRFSASFVEPLDDLPILILQS